MVFESIPALPKSVAGPSFTGTTQFIAKEVLDGYRKRNPVARDVHRDLESFLLVIIYALYRRFVKLNPRDIELRTEYQLLFGSIAWDQISAGRNELFLGNPLPKLRRTVANEDLWLYC